MATAIPSISVDFPTPFSANISFVAEKPSFDVLHKLVRELIISADSIFYPEKQSKDSEAENLLRMLSACDERPLLPKHIDRYTYNNP